MLSSPAPPVRNRLLAALPPCACAPLLAQLEPVELAVAQVLQRPGEALPYVYFPTGALTVVLGQVEHRAPLAVALVGAEGVVGLPALLDAQPPAWTAQVYLAGAALRLPVPLLNQRCPGEAALAPLLGRYAATLLTQIIQNAACARFHPLPARLARWLLMTAEHRPAAALPLTHQLLGALLGVRREAVSHAAAALQQRRLIGYQRGCLQILDHSALHARACPCYPGTGDAKVRSPY